MYLRRKRNGAAGNGLGTTIKYMTALADMTTAGELYDCDEERGLVAYED
jgi:hypothetical protein